MKRSLAIALFLASGLSLSAFAQAPAAAAAPATVPTAKVAVIAFQVVVTQSNEFQRDYADLEKKYEPRKQHLKALNDEIESLTKQLQAQTTLSDADRASRTGDIETKKKQLQRDAEDAQNDFQQDLQQTFGTVAQKVGAEMTKYAHDNGYTLVLDASQQDSPILYAVDTVNITRPVLEAYNQKSGIPAPAPQPAPAAPAHNTAHPPASH